MSGPRTPQASPCASVKTTTTALERQWQHYGEEGQKALLERIALRRLGQPDDIAHGVLFFASDYAGWVTGQVLSIAEASRCAPSTATSARHCVPFGEQTHLRETGSPDLVGEAGYRTFERLWDRPTLELHHAVGVAGRAELHLGAYLVVAEQDNFTWLAAERLRQLISHRVGWRDERVE